MLTIRIESDWQQGKNGTQARAGMYHFVIDEPKAMGGSDLGPNPMQ